jgi:hypothetical protein
MILKIANTLLILIAVYMGLKQGWAMIQGKQQMLDMFGKWQFSRSGITAFGIITVASALLILFPRTFIWGNFLMAASILLIICFHLRDKDLNGAGVELPFFVLNLVIIYLQHPLFKA